MIWQRKKSKENEEEQFTHNDEVEFVINYHKKWNQFKKDLESMIVNKYDDDVNFKTIRPINIEFENNMLFITLIATEIPYRLITDLNEYLGQDCFYIVSIPDSVLLTWKFEED